MASGSEDGTVVVWDVATGELIHRLEGTHEYRVRASVFSPDGSQLLSSAADNTMILWDGEPGELVRQFTGHTNWVFRRGFQRRRHTDHFGDHAIKA